MHPGLRERLNTWIARTIPFLVIAFLLILALLLGLTLYEMRERALDDAAREIVLIDAALTPENAAAAGSAAASGDTSAIERAMRDIATTAAVERRTPMLLADSRGEIVSDGDLGTGLVGSWLDEVLGDQASTRRGAMAGVQRVRVDGARAVASLAEIPSGQLLTYRAYDDILADWRRLVALGVLIFVMTAVVVIVLLYGYFDQASRADTANDRYRGAMGKMDIALARGRCGLWEWDVNRGLVYWSSSMYDILGLEADATIVSFGAMRQLMHPDDDVLFDVAQEIASNKINYIDRAFRMRHANGDYVWLRARCEVERHGAGELFLIGIAMDVTEQQILERRNRTIEAQLHDAVAAISEAFVLWDDKDKLVLCNPKFREWHELDEDAVRPGTPRSEVLPRPGKAGTGGPLRLSDGDAHTYELPDGRWLQISERRTSDGFTASVSTDVTELKRQQENMRRTEQKLMATIRDLHDSRAAAEDRKRELETLSQDYKEQVEAATAANRAKSDFMTNMSHELRTPLNAILGFSEMMEAESFGPLGACEIGTAKYGEYVGDIHRSASHLLALIGDILDMAKIEAGRFEIDRTPIDMGPLVEETVRSVALRAERKSIRVSTDIVESLSVEADARAVKQILLNLLSNAVKFTPEGGAIAVTAKPWRGTMRLVIEDTGVGIPKGALKRVRQPFEQVQDQWTKDHEGSGLGLAICDSLIKLHDGQMKIMSQPGSGTKVIVRVPLMDERDGTATDEVASDGAASDEGASEEGAGLTDMTAARPGAGVAGGPVSAIAPGRAA